VGVMVYALSQHKNQLQENCEFEAKLGCTVTLPEMKTCHLWKHQRQECLRICLTKDMENLHTKNYKTNEGN
jgi:hypothetical protein